MALLSTSVMPLTILAGGASAGAVGLPPTAYVTGTILGGPPFFNPSGIVTPVGLGSGTAGASFGVGTSPNAIAITPNGRTAYVADSSGGTVIPIDLATNTEGAPIPIGASPTAIAITPDGQTAYVVYGNGSVVPVTLATDAVGTPVAVGSDPTAIAITPDGRTAYVTSYGGRSDLPEHLHQSRRLPLGHRHHPQRPDRLRRQPGCHGDTYRHRHRHSRGPDRVQPEQRRL
jgi:YVTN family beta-propeller protein